MARPYLFLAIAVALLAPACTKDASDPAAVPQPVTEVVEPTLSGERLVYVVGCVNCHHQTPNQIMNAPPLLVVNGYSLHEFRQLLSTGVTRDGRDIYAQGSIMGIVAREQLSHLTDEEVAAVHSYLQSGWSAERAAAEDAKIAKFPQPTFKQG